MERKGNMKERNGKKGEVRRSRRMQKRAVSRLRVGRRKHGNGGVAAASYKNRRCRSGTTQYTRHFGDAVAHSHGELTCC